MSEPSRLGQCDDEKQADLSREKCPKNVSTRHCYNNNSFKKDSSIGPYGDYEYSISNSSFSLRSLMRNNNNSSSRNSSGRNDEARFVDDELYDTSEDYIEKLNLVRRKLNLIEISDSEPSDKSDDIKERCNHQISTLFEVEDETESSSIELEIKKSGRLDQISEIVRDIRPLNKFYDQQDDEEIKSVEICESYYEISDKEIRKKGTQNWSVNLDEIITFNTTENEHPPKKKLCTRAATPVLTARSDDHLEPPFNGNSQYYNHERGTQFRVKDIGEEAEEAPSIIDIDKSIGCTQVQLDQSESSSSYTSADNTSCSNILNPRSQSNLHIIPNVIVRNSGSSSLSSTDMDMSPSPSPSPSPTLIKNPLHLPSNQEQESIELELLHFAGRHTNKPHLNLTSLGSSSSNTNTSIYTNTERNTLKQAADIRALRSLNGPQDEEELLEEFPPPDSHHVTVIENNKKSRSFKSKLLSLQANVTSILNPEQSVKKIPYKELIAAMEDDKIPSRNSSALINRLSKLNRGKSSSSSSRSGESFKGPIIDSSIMKTVDLDVPRIATKKFSFPAISYLTGPLHDHRLLQEDDSGSDKFFSDYTSNDCYKDAARKLLEEKSDLNVPIGKKSVKSIVTILPENSYTIHKKQSSGEDFYAVVSASSDEERDVKDPEINPEEETVLLSPAAVVPVIAKSRSTVNKEETLTSSRGRRRCGRWKRLCGCFGYLFESRENEFF